MERIYLDNAATTPMDSEVKKAMELYFCDAFGNPSSLHYFGQQARAAIDSARETVAHAIGAQFREVIFTASATEANSLALRGVIKKARTAFTALHGEKPMRIIVSAIEHDSVLETAKDMEQDGIEVVSIPVTADGIVAVEKIRMALNEQTVLVSIMYANNEVGSVQPIKEIAEMLKTFREQPNAIPYYPLLHTDAVQALQFFDCSVGELGVDLMTLSAHKIYGPKGAGALYARTMDSVTHTKDNRMYVISPRIVGGGQEFGMRSGTENVPAVVGFAKAIEIAIGRREEECVRVARLRDQLWEGIEHVFPEAIVNGGNRKEYASLPNMLNVYFPGYRGGELLVALDLRGVAVSSGSACAARSAMPSHVLMAMGLGEERAGGSLRFSIGRHTTEADIECAVGALKEALHK